MYYNPSTKETLSEQDLKNLLNVSFPEGREQVEEWLFVHDNRPEPKEGKVAVKSTIKVKDGKAVQTYRQKSIPESVPQASVEERIKEVEDAVSALKQSAPEDSNIIQKVSVIEGAIVDLAAMIANLQTYCINSINEIKGEKQ